MREYISVVLSHLVSGHLSRPPGETDTLMSVALALESGVLARLCIRQALLKVPNCVAGSEREAALASGLDVHSFLPWWPEGRHDQARGLCRNKERDEEVTAEVTGGPRFYFLC